MSVQITEFAQRDTPEIMRLHLSVLEEERWFVSAASEYPFDPFSLLEHIKGVVASDTGGWWVARRDGELVGFAMVSGSRLARVAHVVRFEVMVAKSARGQGVGKALTEHAIAMCRSHRVVKKVSLAVFDDNKRAIALYRSLGFVQEGHRHNEYIEADGSARGDVLMALTV